MAPIDGLPNELLTQIFRHIAKQKVERKTFRKFKDGYHLVPSLRSSSMVCLEWRQLILGDVTRTGCTAALLLRFDGEWASPSGARWSYHLQRARDMTQKVPACPLLVFLDLSNFAPSAHEIGLLSLLIGILDINSISNRLQGIEIPCNNKTIRYLLPAFEGRIFTNLEYVGLTIHRGDWEFNKFADIALESRTRISASLFPRVPMTVDPDTDPEYEIPFRGELVFSEMKDLTGIRICNCQVQPTWVDLLQMLKDNPRLENLTTQVAGGGMTGGAVLDETGISDLSLLWLEKCSMKAAAGKIWQFLSIQSLVRLKYLSLTVYDPSGNETIPVSVVTTNLSRLLYLSLDPLCPLTANFLARTWMFHLVTLNLMASHRYGLRDTDYSDNAWPRSITLPALTTLRIAGFKVAHMAFFLRALAEGAGPISASAYPLRSFTLDLTPLQSNARPMDAPESDMLQSVLSEAIFRNVKSLAFEQRAVVVTEGFLGAILLFMPAVSQLYLSQNDTYGPVLPIASESKPRAVLPALLARLSFLDIRTRHSLYELDCNGEVVYEYLSAMDEAALLRLLQCRYDRGLEEGAFLNALRVRIQPGLRDGMKKEIELLKCSVEYTGRSSKLFSVLQEFDDL